MFASEGNAMNRDGLSVRFIEPGKTWHVEEFIHSSHYEMDYCFTAESDTLIGNVHYMRLFLMRDNKEPDIAGIFREEDGIVYRYYPTLKQEYVFYNFTLEPGEIVTLQWDELEDPWQLDVKAVDILTLNDGTQVRKIQLGTIGIEGTDEVWIEGIGNVVSPCRTVRGQVIIGSRSFVTSVKQGEEEIYKVTLSGITDTHASGDTDARAYDLQGRPVDKAAQHGLVITGGRKVLKK